MLTRVHIWDNENGYVPITAQQAMERYNSRISSCSGLLRCSICGEAVTLTVEGKKRSHFRHAPVHGIPPEKVEELCEERSRRQDCAASTSNGIPPHTLPVKINLRSFGFTFSAGFNTFGLLEDLRSHGCDLNDSSITITPSGEGINYSDRYVFNLSRLSDNCLTWLPVSPLPFQRCTLTYRNVHSQLRSLWPDRIDGIVGSDAVFDYDSGRRIPQGARVSWKRKFILLSNTRYPECIDGRLTLKPVSFDPRHGSSDQITGKWFVYEMTVQKLDSRAGELFSNLGLWLVQSTSDVEQVWPPHLSIGDISVNPSRELFFYNPENDSVKVIPDGNHIEQTVCRSGTLVRVNMMHRAQLYMVGTSGLCGYRFIRQEKQLERSGSLPGLTFLNRSAQLVTETCQDLLEGTVNQLRFTAPVKGHVTISEGRRIRKIIKFDSQSAVTVHEDSMRPGWTMEFYLGCNLVQTINILHKELQKDQQLPVQDSPDTADTDEQPQTQHDGLTDPAAAAAAASQHPEQLLSDWTVIDSKLLFELQAAAASYPAPVRPGLLSRRSHSQLRSSQANKTGRRLSRQLTHAPQSRAWLEQFMTTSELTWPMIRLINSTLLRHRP